MSYITDPKKRNYLRSTPCKFLRGDGETCESGLVCIRYEGTRCNEYVRKEKEKE